MTLNQLHEYLNRLIVSGTNPNTPVCMVVNGVPVEVNDLAVMTGLFTALEPGNRVAKELREGRMLLVSPGGFDLTELTEVAGTDKPRYKLGVVASYQEINQFIDQFD